MANQKVQLCMENRRLVTLCNHNFSREGILHPDRIMEEYDLLFMQNGEWNIIEDGQEFHLIPGSVLLLEPGKHHYSMEKCSPMMRNIYIHFRRDARDMDSSRISELVQEPISGNIAEQVSASNNLGNISAQVSPKTEWDVMNRLVHNHAAQNRNTEKGTHPNQTSAGTDSMLHEPQTNSPITNRSYLSVPKLIQTADHKEIRHTFEKIIDAFWAADDATRQLRCSLLLENLLLQLSELGNTESHGKTDVLITEIIHRFHVNPEEFLSPKELADNYHVSVRTISGRFKERTGMSVHQYQIQLKLDMAYDILPLSPERSLHDIALSFGFYDEFQFSKLFKRKFGISPSERR